MGWMNECTSGDIDIITKRCTGRDNLILINHVTM